MSLIGPNTKFDDQSVEETYMSVRKPPTSKTVHERLQLYME